MKSKRILKLKRSRTEPAKPRQVLRVVRMRKRIYYSLHWRINGNETGLSGALTEMASHAVCVLGRGADVVVITKCQTESANVPML